jgi:hypothetical protein
MRGRPVISSTRVPKGRAQHQLVRLLVVEVDEARVRLERVRDPVGDEREHLLEVERRVDGRDRFGQEAQMAGGLVHSAIVGSRLAA